MTCKTENSQRGTSQIYETRKKWIKPGSRTNTGPKYDATTHRTAAKLRLEIQNNKKESYNTFLENMSHKWNI
jgi:hypothetical protein